MQKTVLAIDPGTSKCGLALVRRDDEHKLEILWRGIVPVEELEPALCKAAEVAPFSLVIAGSGTNSKEIVRKTRETMPSMAVLVVDEKDTSYQARERYWEHHPRRGWRRIWPASMQVPPEPLDDFVAYMLAERVLAQG